MSQADPHFQARFPTGMLVRGTITHLGEPPLGDQDRGRYGKMRLDLHDGSNYLVEETGSLLPEKVVYTTLDVLKLSIPDRELLNHTKLDVGASVIVIGGKNMGKVGKIDKIEKQADKKRRDLIVTIKDENGNQLQTILDLVFALGDNESLTSVSEAK